LRGRRWNVAIGLPNCSRRSMWSRVSASAPASSPSPSAQANTCAVWKTAARSHSPHSGVVEGDLEFGCAAGRERSLELGRARLDKGETSGTGTRMSEAVSA
jgi:hypothetical protein